MGTVGLQEKQVQKGGPLLDPEEKGTLTQEPFH